MSIIISAKIPSWKKRITLVIISCIVPFIFKIILALIVFISCGNSKQYMEMEALKFQEWKAPMEMLLTRLKSIQTMCFIFAYAYAHPPFYLLYCSLQANHQLRPIDISYEPARNVEFGTLGQGAAIDGSSTEAATQHAIHNKSQAIRLPQRHIMPLKRKSTKLPQRIQVPQQHTMPSTLDNKENKDDKATAIASEQFTEADMDTDSTAVDIKATSPSPRVFLRRMSTASDWQRETLTQILAISRADEASEAVPRPEWVSIAILSQKRPQTPSPSLR